jgi:hypothetical protein
MDAVEAPTTRYAWNGDVALAYQVAGEGSTDLVYMQGWISNVDLNRENPRSRYPRSWPATPPARGTAIR